MEWVLPDFASSEMWVSLLTLTFLEIVLGIDNILFISIVSNKLPEDQQKKGSNIGLLLAMVLRILLLFGVTWLISMQEPWLSFHNSWLNGDFSGQSLILIAGGIFLLYKSTTEIHHKLEGQAHEAESGPKPSNKLTSVILQIAVINIVFSFDSILTAVGMTNGLHGALFIMIVAVVLSVVIMMVFSLPVSRFINRHPSFQVLGLSFLLLIGFMLIAEGAHLGHFELAGAEIGAVPKGYLYFAIAFSLFVEVLNLRLRKRQAPVQLHGAPEEAVAEGLLDKKGN
ncbi:MAG: TerC family protein [Saprospirales bacterium]|nr:TerC family protein [Saprospirales bacterium]